MTEAQFDEIARKMFADEAIEVHIDRKRKREGSENEQVETVQRKVVRQKEIMTSLHERKQKGRKSGKYCRRKRNNSETTGGRRI